MNNLAKYWTTLLFHAFVALSAALLFLFSPELNPENPLLFLAVPLIVAVVVQLLIWWKSNWSGRDWPAKLSLILVDLFLAIWVLREPEQSMRLFLIVLAIWSALIAVLLLWNYRKQEAMRAPLILTGFIFLVISGYLFWQSTRAETTNLIFLGIVLSAFSLFLILIAVQLRARIKKQQKPEVPAAV